MRQTVLPASARELSTLAHIDYQDAFLVEAGLAPGRTAEQWAREVLEGAPASTRRALGRGWNGLGLRLGPARSNQRILGWEIRRSDPDVVLLLGACGRLGYSPVNLSSSAPRTRCSTPPSCNWTTASPAVSGRRSSPRHRRVVQGLLERV